MECNKLKTVKYMAKIAVVVIRHIIVKLDWPDDIPGRLSLGKKILSKITGNSNFPVSTWPSIITSLAQLTTDVNAFDAAETAQKSKTGTVTARDIAMNATHSDLRSIKVLVQAKCDANPINAEDIALGAGYDIKVVVIKQQQQNSVQDTEVPGTILATADGTGYHMWQITQDQKTITTLDSTSTAHTLIPNLTSGATYYVRSKKIATKKKTYAWGAWMEIKVK